MNGRFFTYGAALALISGAVAWLSSRDAAVNETEKPGAPGEAQRHARPEAKVVGASAPLAPPPAPLDEPKTAPEPEPRSELGPQCKSDSDCRGPRTPDCVRTMCESGRCTTDDSSCGCKTSADCDDGDPCTRDLCFARTKKCVAIPQDCN